MMSHGPIVTSHRNRIACSRVTRRLAILQNTLFIGLVNQRWAPCDCGSVSWSGSRACRGEFLSLATSRPISNMSAGFRETVARKLALHLETTTKLHLCDVASSVGYCDGHCKTFRGGDGVALVMFSLSSIAKNSGRRCSEEMVLV